MEKAAAAPVFCSPSEVQLLIDLRCHPSSLGNRQMGEKWLPKGHHGQFPRHINHRSLVSRR